MPIPFLIIYNCFYKDITEWLSLIIIATYNNIIIFLKNNNYSGSDEYAPSFLIIIIDWI